MLWEDTFKNFFSYFDVLGDYFGSKVLFLGDYYYSDILPYYYLIFWIYISTPILHLFLFTFGFGYYVRRLINRFFKIKEVSLYSDLWRSNGESKDFLIFLNLVVFFIFFSFMNIQLYNSWRIAYFLYIFMIYFAVYSIYILSLISKRKKIKFRNRIGLVLTTIFILFSC